jgi:hypothetical protein
MATLTRVTALVVFVAGLAAAAPGLAQSQTDFDACHQMAASKVQGAVSASPSSDSVTSSSPGTSTSSSARGEMGSSTSVSGSTGSSTSAAASTSAREALQDDPTYQQAFRSCLKARGF